MTLAELRELPNEINVDTSAMGGNNGHVHESVFRSYAMLQKVKQLLMSDQPVPPVVIIEMIEDVMDAPSVRKNMASNVKVINH